MTITKEEHRHFIKELDQIVLDFEKAWLNEATKPLEERNLDKLERLKTQLTTYTGKCTDSLKPYSLRLEQDEDVWNPRQDDAYESKFYTWERNYFSPDKCPYSSLEDAIFNILPRKTLIAFDLLDEEDENQEDKINTFLFESENRLNTQLQKLFHHAEYDAHFVTRFEHGNRTYSLKDIATGWDTALIGFIYKPTDCKEDFKLQLKEYTAYVNGECYALVYKQGDQVIDSVSGLYLYDCETPKDVQEHLINLANELFEPEIPFPKNFPISKYWEDY